MRNGNLGNEGKGPFKWARQIALLLVGSCGLQSESEAQGIPDPQSELARKAATILRDNCAACHSNGSNSLAGVRYRGDFDSVLDWDALRSGFYLDLDEPEQSELYRSIASGEMPHREAVAAGYARVLNAGELATILAWIRAGAPSPVEVEEAMSDPSVLASIEPIAFSAASLDRGESIFRASCTACHPATRALGVVKNFEDWKATIERMANKPGAHIAEDDFGAIASFLTQETASSAAEAHSSLGRTLFESLSLHGTFSTAWLGSGRDEALENPNFTVEAWVSAEWNPNDSPMSARVTACTTCHASAEPEGRRVEIAEAAFRLDLDEAWSAGKSRINSYAEAGRFIVPFGGFSAQSNPAAYRTVTRPLLYNMGQMVERNMIGPAVLPMPYSDEGLRLNLSAPLGSKVSTEFDAYVVNGLQGRIGADFLNSRSYSDNNGEPAIGGRLVFSTPSVSIGASGMMGRLEDDVTDPGGKLDYQIVGLDLNARLGERVRFLAEVARRESERATFQPTNPNTKVTVEGLLLKGNFLLHEDSGLSFVARYDTLHYEGLVGLPTSTLRPDYHARRTTWGFEFGLPGGSTLMLNHEHWSLPGGLDSVDVVGARWVASF